jgi:hypothetical protein
MAEYRISVDELDMGRWLVQAHGDPYPLGIYKESGPALLPMLLLAGQAIARHTRAADRRPTDA